MSIGPQSCPGCIYSGHSHLEGCPNGIYRPAAAPTPAEPVKKYRERCESRKDGQRCIYHYSHVGPHGNEDRDKEWFDLVPAAPAESQGQPAPTQIAAKRYYDRQKEQIAAESQGVERAQPVEGPRETKCIHCGQTLIRPHGVWVHSDDNSVGDRGHFAAPVEGVERVTDDRLPDSFGLMGPSPAVEAFGRKFEALAHSAMGDAIPDLGPLWGSMNNGIPEPGAKTHTDDRPAETIPDPRCIFCGSVRLIMCNSEDPRSQFLCLSCNKYVTREEASAAIPDDLGGKLWREYWTPIGPKSAVGFQEFLIERTGRAETRIEVLEAALRNMVKVVGELYPLEGPPEPIHNAEYRAVYWAIHKSRAALAAPSGVKTP